MSNDRTDPPSATIDEVLTQVADKDRVVAAMNETACPKTLLEHLLIALLRQPQGQLPEIMREHQLDPEKVAGQISNSIARSGAVAHACLVEAMLSDDARAALEEYQSSKGADLAPAARELLYAAVVLGRCGPQTGTLLEYGGIDKDKLAASLRDRATQPDVVLVEPFNEDGTIRLESFDRVALRYLRRLESEGRGLGLDFIGSPLMLMTLLASAESVADRAIRAQGRSPDAIYKALLLRLRALRQKGQLTDLQVRRQSMQEIVVQIFGAAARDARDHHSPLIGESHLFRALVSESGVLLGVSLQENNLDAAELLRHAIRNYDPDAAAEEIVELPPVAEVLDRLRRRIIGQDQVIDSLQTMLNRLRFNYVRRNRPLGVFLFLGPSGTGKTETAKALAQCIYGSEEKLIHLDMGTFGSEHDKSMFIGAPPGYVGFGEGQLTNGLRDKPECVVLFDEVEKANKSVFDVLLRFLDEGVIADPAGPVRDGRRCIIVLTSNIMLDGVCDMTASDDSRPADSQDIISNDRLSLGHLYRLDPHARQARLRQALRKVAFFRPEFINRVNEIHLFRELGREQYCRIIEQQLRAEVERMKEEKAKEFAYDDSLVQELANRCMTRSQEGARVVANVIDSDVITPLIDFFSSDEHQQVSRVHVGLEGQKTVVHSV